MLNICIPLSGAGSRFAEADYTFPKPLIDVDGEAMIAKVITNLIPENRKDVRFIFIVQKEHCKKYKLKSVLKHAVAGLPMEVIEIDKITKGAACTVLLAADYINNEDELMIANSDQLIESPDNYEMNLWYNNFPSEGVDGFIMVFKANHPKWSYAKVDKEEFVIEVAEKKVISDYATTGVYWFKHGKDFVKGAEEMIKKDIRTNNEFYVCPVYNELILADKKIKISEIDKENMKGLGTPEDLTKYLNENKQK